MIIYLLSLLFFALSHFLWHNDTDTLFWGIIAILNLVEYYGSKLEKKIDKIPTITEKEN